MFATTGRRTAYKRTGMSLGGSARGGSDYTFTQDKKPTADFPRPFSWRSTNRDDTKTYSLTRTSCALSPRSGRVPTSTQSYTNTPPITSCFCVMLLGKQIDKYLLWRRFIIRFWNVWYHLQLKGIYSFEGRGLPAS